MKVRIHPHCLVRMKERGCTKADVIHTLKHGSRLPAKFNRTKFGHRFSYNRKWLGTFYRFKTVEAFAIDEAVPPDKDDWLVITVIVYYSN